MKMQLRKTYVALLARDLPAAEEWYTKLLGRGPDFRPMDSLVQWELSDYGGLQLSTQSELSGAGAMSLVVDDVDAERARLHPLGIQLGENMQGTYSTLASVRDRDGNLIVLGTPPSPSYPTA